MAASNKLKNDIRVALSGNEIDCLSITALRKIVQEEINKIREALNELIADHKVRREGSKYCIDTPILSPSSLKLRCDIMKTVASSKESIPTSLIAERMGVDSRKIYQTCRSLEKRGFLKRGKPLSKRGYFAPITGETIHRGNYNRINGIYKKLGGIVKDYELGNPQMKSDLNKLFGEMLTKKDFDKYKKSISSFRNNLLSTVSSADKKSEINKSFGIRPFDIKITTWKSPF
jgi:hypothetical protein